MRCDHQAIAIAIVVYAATVAIAAPIIPYDGIRARFSAKLTSAPAPVTTQLNVVRRARPTPIATTTYAAYATVEKASGPTTRDDSANCAAARRSTSHGDSSVSASATQAVTTVRYVSTKAYVRRASRSSRIE